MSSNLPPRVTQKMIDDPTYGAVHTRLRKQRGNARTHLCECGKRAQHWALIGDPKWDDPRPYTDDLSAYTPMCMSCHFRMDAWWGTTCKRGHERTPENTSVYNGSLKCRLCINETQNERRRRNRVTQ